MQKLCRGLKLCLKIHERERLPGDGVYRLLHLELCLVLRVAVTSDSAGTALMGASFLEGTEMPGGAVTCQAAGLKRVLIGAWSSVSDGSVGTMSELDSVSVRRWS